MFPACAPPSAAILMLPCPPAPGCSSRSCCLLVALGVFIPGVLYFTELALRELRFMWWLILLLGGVIWLLTRLKRKE